MLENKDSYKPIQQIEELVEQIERTPDSNLRSAAQKLVHSLLDLHGSGIHRILEIVSQSGEAGRLIIERFAQEPLVRSLLLLHGLHPLELETRVKQGLDQVRPYLHSQGVTVDLLSIEAGAVRVKLLRKKRGCATSARPLTLALEQAIYDSAPDVSAIEIESVIDSFLSDFVPVEKLIGQPTSKRASGACCELCGLELVVCHQHLLELPSRRLQCACDACAILFSSQGGTKYRRVPLRISFLADFALPDDQWDRLMIPVNLAFFFRSSSAGKIVAVYPSAAGPMESLLGLEAWNDIVENNQPLQHMEDDVEALLVNRVGRTGVEFGGEYYLVPIDECYRLIGVVRAHWRGLSGGSKVWEQIGEFFAGLKERSSQKSGEMVPA